MKKDTKIVIGAIAILVIMVFTFNAGITGAFNWKSIPWWFWFMKPAEPNCISDSDGENIYVQGSVEFESQDPKVDYCQAYVYDYAQRRWIGFHNTNDCEIKKSAAGGTIVKCYVNEYSCEGGVLKEKRIECPAGACKEGMCLVSYCGDGECSNLQYTMMIDQTIMESIFPYTTITLLNVGSSGAIQINVGGTIEVIPAATEETIEGFEITNHEAFYADYMAERYATLRIDENGVWCPQDCELVPSANECVDAGYKCTSAIRGCGHYEEFNLACSVDPTGLTCCAEIPYCGDGVCFTHDTPGYGETPENCPDDCKLAGTDYFTLDIKEPTTETTTPTETIAPWRTTGAAILSNYIDLVIEYRANEDLARSGYSGMSSVEKTIRISSPVKGMFSLASDPTAEINYIWLTKEGNDILVFYRDVRKVPSIIYFGKVDTSVPFGDRIVEVKNGDSIHVYPGYEQLKVNYKLNANDYINSYFGVYNEEITSLGGIRALEEADELRLFEGGSYLLLGDHSGDYTTSDGVIIKDPKSNGGSDQVLLEILF